MEKEKHNKKQITIEWNGQGFILWRSDQLFDLSMRLYLCEVALRQYSKVATSIEADRFADSIRENAAAHKEEISIDLCDLSEILNSIGISDEDKLNDIIDGSFNCDISERDSLKKLGRSCLLLSTLYDYIKFNWNVKERTTFLTTLALYNDTITSKSHESIGYWSAKLEEMKRNKIAVAPRTKKKDEKKAYLSEMLMDISPGDKKAFKQLLRNAMNKFDCTEMNVRALIKEIKTKM